MSAGFTPGPWAFNSPWAGFSSIEDAYGNLIFGIARGDPEEAQPIKTCEANARLIAAAPDLYEALKTVLEQFVDPQQGLDQFDSAIVRKSVERAIDALARVSA